MAGSRYSIALNELQPKTFARTWRMVVLSAGIGSTLEQPKERT
jgi:hypothetical protein